MLNPIPKRFRRPLNNVLLFAVFYLAIAALHAMIEGRIPFPSISVLVGWLIGSVIGVLVWGARESERA